MTTLPDVLHDLTDLAADAADDAPTRAALARTVELLERAADASLGGTDRDPLVVLQRRLGRAALRLTGRSAPGLAAQVDAVAAVLRCPAAGTTRRPDAPPRPVGVLAGC